MIFEGGMIEEIVGGIRKKVTMLKYCPHCKLWLVHSYLGRGTWRCKECSRTHED